MIECSSFLIVGSSSLLIFVNLPLKSLSSEDVKYFLAPVMRGVFGKFFQSPSDGGREAGISIDKR